ncbi:MAG: bifunctional nuclease family protein [Coriobacteriia bacterium]|nr:bifunctional nuclease family protein [Coriobacteriia bacterium]
MILVRIDTLMVGIPPSPSVIILRPMDESPNISEKRVLPIWIGPSEAASIGVALEGAQNQRPMTHDLLATAIEALDGEIDSILINRVDGSTFYATVFLTQGDKTIEIDARPSDSIALAVRSMANIYVDEQVMEDASRPFLPNRESAAIDEQDIEEFRAFLDSVSPEDFKSS